MASLHVHHSTPYDATLFQASSSQNASTVTMEYFFKTKLCPRIKSNSSCRRGSNCPFAHSDEELRPLPNLHKTKLCSNYAQFRKCIAGESCTFAHGEHELRMSERSAANTCSELNKPKKPVYEVPHIDNCQDFYSPKSSLVELENWQKLFEALGGKSNGYIDLFKKEKDCDNEHFGNCFQMGAHEINSQHYNFLKMQGFKRTRRGKRGGKNKNQNGRGFQSSTTNFNMGNSRFSKLAALLSSLEPQQAQFCLELLQEERRKDFSFESANKTQFPDKYDKKAPSPWPSSSLFHNSGGKFCASPFNNAGFSNNGNKLSDAIQKSCEEPWQATHFKNELQGNFSNFNFPNDGNQRMYNSGIPGALLDSLKSISTFDAYPTEKTTCSMVSASDYFMDGELEDRTTVAFPQHTNFGNDVPFCKEPNSLEPNQKYLDLLPTFLPQ